jgi:hypothetical protein
VVGTTNILSSFRGFTIFDQSASASHTVNFSPTMLNNFIFSYNRNNGEIVSGSPASPKDLSLQVRQRVDLNRRASGIRCMTSRVRV